MKPFREFYLDKWPDADVYPWPRGAYEPTPPVMVRIAEACADYMDELREELQPSHLPVGLQCPWCRGSDQHEPTCEYRSYGNGSIVPMRGRYSGPHPSPRSRKVAS